MNIRDAIRALAANWINESYARSISVPMQVDHLIIHAFVNRIPEGNETALLREAHRRLQACALNGEWP